MGIFKAKWFDFLATYILFIAMMVCARSLNNLFIIPVVLFGFYLYRGCANWLFVNEKIRLLMGSQLKVLTRGRERVSKLEITSLYTAWLFMIFVPTISLSYHLSELLK